MYDLYVCVFRFDIDAELRKVEETHAGGDNDKPAVNRPKSELSEKPQINGLPSLSCCSFLFMPLGA